MSKAVTAANALTARWAQAALDGTGTVLSGAGLWPLLGLIAGGADGPVRAELEDALGMDAVSAAAGAGELIATIDGAEAARAALGLWTREWLTLRPDWLDRLPPATHGVLVDDDATNQRRLDGWAAEHTNGLIPRMPVEVRPATLLVLASALALRTEWTQPFTESSLPVEGPWAGGGPVVGLSRNSSDLSLLSIVDDWLSVVRVVGSTDVDVHLLLGAADRSPGAVVAGGIAALDPAVPRVDGTDLAIGDTGPGVTVRESSFETRPTLRVLTPRFRVTAAHDLLRHAGLFGLATAVGGDGPQNAFAGISETPLRLDDARQNALAVFTATGFEAAAVTAIGMRSAALAGAREAVKVVSVILDRPYGFLAVHRPTGLVLVAGWVAEPDRR